jgi:hypothetical protein
MTLRITGFVDFVHCLKFWILENTTFQKLDVFLSNGEDREMPTLLSPLEGDNLKPGPGMSSDWGYLFLRDPKG